MTRRELQGGAALVGLAAVLASGRRLAAQETVDLEDEYPTRPVRLGLIGTGLWGKEIARSLAKVTNASLKTVCDSADAEQAKVATVVPDAEFVADYRRVLDDKAIEGVIIATPTHRHRQIVLDALAAGKHVYCEAPLAVTTEDLTAICRAAREAKVVFQPGLQRRCHPFTKRVKSAAVDGSLQAAILLNSHARQQVNWMRDGGTPERAKERSWRAYADSSLGPVGELGIHQIDVANYWLNGKPTSVRGVGRQTLWVGKGWEVPDTTICQFDYPRGLQANIESSTASSHWGNSEELVGVGATVLYRDNEEQSLGYLFKEPGTAALGWEVYAKKESVLGEIAFIMRPTPKGGFDINKLEEGKLTIGEPLHYSLGSFARRVEQGGAPLVGWQKAYEANVIAIRAAQAVREGTTVTFAKEDFTLA
ncbi:MAG: Gfo/Idh/MocA family oxidoreductase [Armatimonadetes bacterium]|nr:Gfo/Idh/MocA family oxidoreductase [Armatimonadota bacterium]